MHLALGSGLKALIENDILKAQEFLSIKPKYHENKTKVFIYLEITDGIHSSKRNLDTLQCHFFGDV